MINHLDDVHFNRVKEDNWKGMFHFLNFITLLVDITRQKLKKILGRTKYVFAYIFNICIPIFCVRHK